MTLAFAASDLDLAASVLDHLYSRPQETLPPGTTGERFVGTARKVLATAIQSLGNPPKRSRFEEVAPLLGPLFTALGEAFASPATTSTPARVPFPHAKPSSPLVTPAPPGNNGSPTS